MLYLDVKLEQAKTVLNLQCHNNYKNNLFKEKQASGKVPQLFLEAEEDIIFSS